MTADQAVRAVAVTGRGLVRDGNEDAVLVFEWQCQSSRPQVADLRVPWTPPLVCAVADGLGGHLAGELASRLALGAVAARYASWTDPGALAEGVVAINDSLYETAQASPGTAGMGTTLAGVVLAPDGALCFNVGDSRVYQIVDGYVEQISVDDSGAGDGRVSQALGGPPDAFLAPHVAVAPLTAGARFLLCTDGAYGAVEDAAFRRLCRTADLDALVRGLRDAAYDGGAPDNVSVVALDVPPRAAT